MTKEEQEWYIRKTKDILTDSYKKLLKGMYADLAVYGQAQVKIEVEEQKCESSQPQPEISPAIKSWLLTLPRR